MKMIQVIADLNGCQYDAARDRVESLGLICQGEYRKQKGEAASWNHEQTKELVSLWRQGITVDMISKIINRTPRAIHSKLGHLKSDGSIYQY